TFLCVVGIGCGLLFVSFEREESTWPGGHETDVTIGLKFSPWFKQMTRQEPGRFTTTGGVQLLSWSWLTLLVGGVCLKLAWDLRPRTPPAPPAKPAEGGAPG